MACTFEVPPDQGSHGDGAYLCAVPMVPAGGLESRERGLTRALTLTELWASLWGGSGRCKVAFTDRTIRQLPRRFCLTDSAVSTWALYPDSSLPAYSSPKRKESSGLPITAASHGDTARERDRKAALKMCFRLSGSVGEALGTDTSGYGHGHIQIPV